MKFSQLAIYIQQIDKTQSRLEITRLLSELYLKLNKEEIDKNNLFNARKSCSFI